MTTQMNIFELHVGDEAHTSSEIKSIDELIGHIRILTYKYALSRRLDDPKTIKGFTNGKLTVHVELHWSKLYNVILNGTFRVIGHKLKWPVHTDHSSHSETFKKHFITSCQDDHKVLFERTIDSCTHILKTNIEREWVCI